MRTPDENAESIETLFDHRNEKTDQRFEALIERYKRSDFYGRLNMFLFYRRFRNRFSKVDKGYDLKA